jgi:hypothetical protein
MSADIETFKSRSTPVTLDGIDLDDFRRVPLDAGVLRCLQYMHDVEYHTVCYLRDMLVTPAHLDPEVTTFLTLWNVEEFFHGEAIGAVLLAHDRVGGNERVRSTRQTLGWWERLTPVAHALTSAVTGTSYTAVHMTWGALNEWTANAAYARLATVADHPTLTELLRRIMRQEGRHADFYARQAATRLVSDRRARWLTRVTLRHWWAPVGSTLMPKHEVAFLARFLFSGPEGRAMTDRIDSRLSRLPGLDGLDLASAALARLAA